MKKFAVMMMLLTMGITACGAKSTTKADGVYKAEMDDAAAEAAYGWRDTLEVEYKGGKIVSATFESYNADGKKKSEASAEEYPMDPLPSEWIPKLSENIAKAGKADAIDGVSGATNASSNAKALMNAIEKDGKAGETIQVSGK